MNNRMAQTAARFGAAAAILLLIPWLLAACAGKDAAKPLPAPAANVPPANLAPAQPVDAVKLMINKTGLYRVTAADLRMAGFDPTLRASEQLALTLNDEPVALQVEGTGDALTVTFYGEARVSRYGTANAYWLRWLDGATARVTARPVQPVTDEKASTVAARVHIEEALYYLSQTPADTDHWLGPTLFAPAAYTMTFDLPDWAADSDTSVVVSVWGNTEDLSIETDHHALLTVNDSVVADESWEGKGWHTISATLPVDLLQPAGNTLVLAAPGDTGASVDVLYFDRAAIHYQRTATLAADQLAFASPAGQSVTVAGADSTTLLWDVSDPRQAQSVTGARASQAGLSFKDSAGDTARQYIASTPTALLQPPAIVPVAGADLRTNTTGADYIAVVYPEFSAALQPLLEYRRSQGLRVVEASIEDVYNTFSGGMVDPAAIRAYMQSARAQWPEPAPRFLLLVGDASYDYQGFLPKSTPDYVPTYLLQTHFVGETASDNWFVSLDETDDRPDMAVGRIPAQTAAQVADAVAKTLAYEQAATSSAWISRALFVADNEQTSFQQISDELATNFLPSGYQAEKVYLGINENPNATVIADLNQGVGLVTYVGHGSMNVWAKDKMLHIEDAVKLNNKATPFLMTMTCLVGYFHHPTANSMAEELLFNAHGGVVAAFVPTSESLANDQSQLAENLYTHLFGDAPTVGEAIMLAKQDLSAEHDLMQDLIETFTLLGDPALQLQRPH